MARKVAYWVSTSLVAAMSLFAGFAYLSGSPGIRPRGISSATEDYSGDRQTSWRDRAARTWHGETQRVGLCRIRFRVDLRVFRALSCRRWAKSILAAGIIGAPSRLISYARCEPAGSG